MKKRFVVALLCVTVAASQAEAHHSYAMFEVDVVRSYTGTVKAWTYANPHALLVLAVTEPDGTVKDWMFEMRAPGELARQGLRSIDIKIGDRMAVNGRPSRDGRPFAALVDGVTAEGKKFVQVRARQGQ